MIIRKRISNILSNKYWEYFIIFLILIYCLLVFVNFGLVDSENDEITLLSKFIEALTYIELGILIVFTFEIMGNIYVYGLKVFFFNYDKI